MEILLEDFKKNYYSQHGEDGIIEKIFEIIPRDNWCVEFGAWDGKYLSNTCYLIENYGYNAVLIEGNYKKYQELINNFKDNKSVIALNNIIGFNDKNNLDSILKTSPIPENFDLLSIDIDGNDYHVWDSINAYKPKVVCIEYNPTIPNGVEFIQKKDMKISQGNSATAICKLATIKGYELVATTGTNLIFVDEKYFSLFGINDNSLNKLKKTHLTTYLFSGYDGTVFIEGEKNIHWHRIHFQEANLQQLPKIKKIS